MKNVLVTGASKGIGYAIAVAFLENGDRVFVCSRHLKDLDELKLRGAYCFETDVSDEKSVEAMFQVINAKFEHLDILVNNAGISYVGLLQDMRTEEFDRLIAINLRGAFLCTKKTIPAMIQRQSGSIINISSMWGERGASMEVAYSASKGGLNGFTRALAKELAPSKIRVNAIACGAIDTRMNGFLSQEERTDIEESIGLGRFGRPEEVADLALYLASDKSSYLTGEVITLDGIF